MLQKRKPNTTPCKHEVVCGHCVVCTLWQNGTLEPTGTKATIGSGIYDRNGMCKYSKQGVCDHYESKDAIEIPDEDLREGINYLIKQAES